MDKEKFKIEAGTAIYGIATASLLYQMVNFLHYYHEDNSQSWLVWFAIGAVFLVYQLILNSYDCLKMLKILKSELTEVDSSGNIRIMIRFRGIELSSRIILLPISLAFYIDGHISKLGLAIGILCGILAIQYNFYRQSKEDEIDD